MPTLKRKTMPTLYMPTYIKEIILMTSTHPKAYISMNNLKPSSRCKVGHRL